MPKSHKNSSPPDPPANGPALFAVAHRRTGTIARLPKEVRWRINQMMDDGIAL